MSDSPWNSRIDCEKRMAELELANAYLIMLVSLKQRGTSCKQMYEGQNPVY